MVKLLLAQLWSNHKEITTKINWCQSVTYYERTIIYEIKERFQFGWNKTWAVSVEQIAYFLDSCYKDLEFKPITVREKNSNGYKGFARNI